MPNGDHDDYSKLGWAEWKGRIGERVQTLADNQKEMFAIIGRLREDMAFAKGKAAVYGAIAGVVVSIALMLLQRMLKP
jgi:hypothetical protein